MKHIFKILGFSFLNTKDKTKDVFNPIAQVFRFLFNRFSSDGLMSNTNGN